MKIIKWVFEPIEYGNGGSYRQVNAQSPNCLGYVLFLNISVNPNGLGWGSSHKTKDHIPLLKAAIEGHGQTTCRVIDTYSSPIDADKYRVAVRAPNLLDGVHRYHFIMQLSNGMWAGKDNTDFRILVL